MHGNLLGLIMETASTYFFLVSLPLPLDCSEPPPALHLWDVKPQGLYTPPYILYGLRMDSARTQTFHIWQVTLPECHMESKLSPSKVWMNLLGLQGLGSDSPSPIFIHLD